MIVCVYDGVRQGKSHGTQASRLALGTRSRAHLTHSVDPARSLAVFGGHGVHVTEFRASDAVE